MFEDIISSIKPLDIYAMDKCQQRLDNLTKPLNSLNCFEHIACQIAGVTGNPRPRDLKKSIIIMAADNGVYDDFCNGRAPIKAFAEHISAETILVDIGVAADLESSSRNAAMTREEVLSAIQIGCDIARQQIEKGVQLIGLGEIGVGNTIPAMAVVSCYRPEILLELKERGLSEDKLLTHQLEAVQRALIINKPDLNDPLGVVSKVGCLELAGLIGVILGAASGGAAVVLDGQVTGAAALIAVKMAPAVKDYLIGSHYCKGPVHKAALDLIGIPAYLHLDISLGQGVGAALGMSLVNASLHVLNDMKTFGEAQVAVAQDGPGALKQNQNF